MENYHSLSVVYVSDDVWKNTIHCISDKLLGQSYGHDPISYTAPRVLREKCA